MRKIRLFVCVVAAVCLAMSGCSSRKAADSEVVIDAAKLRLFAPVPELPAVTGTAAETRIVLGRMLYYEPRLSKSHTISCNTCHPLASYGADGKPTSEGHKGKRGDRNSPTVYNAFAHVAQFWDGRAADVEEQAKGPVMNPVEMAMPSEKAAIAVLRSMPEYVSLFAKAFPGEKDPVTFDNMAKAIGAFERRLVTPSRWDRFLLGDQAAITAEEKSGFLAFIAAGCQTCHSGMLVGGTLYQKLGLVEQYPDTSDTGRYNLTKNEADKMLFKVPSLRNVEKTAPYFHNGKIPTLETAVSQMGVLQLGNQLTKAEITSILAWLKSLTGEISAEYIKEPELPKSTARTPKPSLAD